MQDSPVLDKAKFDFSAGIDEAAFPFSLPVVRNLTEISFSNQVTFLVGENGTGKSTILEAIAHRAGFGAEGGSRNFSFRTTFDDIYTAAEKLASHLTLSWRIKPRNGYFFRAESFFNVANYMEHLARLPIDEGGEGPETTFRPYGGKSLHEQSHGESFLAFFNNRLGTDGFFVFDEPEAALSPQRQLTLLRVIHDMCKNPKSQFIIATHSPILLAYPGATIYSCDGEELKEVKYEDTKHYEITKGFLDNPRQYLKHLFED